ncbi:YbaY family lipoprotein [Comamonas endophytica]|uniref:YbaY family lipoprotein n=1 Tax=Comamonas endophytica TaxID=2949090 RepID=A0ABY6G8I7_9BURK|nr:MULTISPECIES: YbaY family lipoprotein [unclassified Acidovorax]MCD2514205.1 YbaY family lipoprotein [Acidovorax sp. D4N7]UYG51343.1 YbaY family lipoprotein [Acidovorax sp. 5MLIR]
MISSITSRRALFATLASAALLAACAQPGKMPAPQANAIVGTVDLAERVMVPPQSTLIVELHQIAQPSAPAQIVGQTAINIETLKPPFKFILPTNNAPINQEAEYRVSARITLGNQTTFASDTAYPVLTRGAGKTANLMLVRVAP